MADNLWAISIDPDQSLREYLLLQLKVRAMRDMLFRSRIFNYLAAATPGLQGAGHDREDLGAGPARPQGQEGAQVRPGDRRRAGHRARHRLPADAAHLRRHRARRARSTPRPRRSTAFITDHDTTGVAIVALPEEMPVNESAGARADAARATSGVAVDRVYMNALYPERFSKGEAARARARRSTDADGAVRGGGARGALRAPPRRAPSASSSPRLAEPVTAPVKTLPFIFEPELGVAEIGCERLSAERSADAGDRARSLEGKRDLHLRRLGRRRQDDDLGGDRRRAWPRAGRRSAC